MVGFLRRLATRAYSTGVKGHIKTQGDIVTLYAAHGQDTQEVLASKNQDQRSSIVSKLRDSLLYNQLNSTKRKLVFTKKGNAHLKNLEDPIEVDLVYGRFKDQIELEPLEYAGDLSAQQYRLLVLLSKTPEEIEEALEYANQTMRTDALKSNFPTTLLPYFLKRAAAAGNFRSVFTRIKLLKGPFKSMLGPQFYSAALPYYALRIPYLSGSSLERLKGIYDAAEPGLNRELAYLYGLVEYHQKFPEFKVDAIPFTIHSIKELLEESEGRPNASASSLVLGYEALKQCEIAGAAELADEIAAHIEAAEKERPIEEVIVLNVAEDKANKQPKNKEEAEESQE